MTPLSKELLLPPRQAHFVEAYCMGQNATKAAMAAGYSIKTAHVQGSRMLKNIKFLSKIEDRLQGHQRRCSITVDMLTAELEEARTLAMKKINLQQLSGPSWRWRNSIGWFERGQRVITFSLYLRTGVFVISPI